MREGAKRPSHFARGANEEPQMTDTTPADSAAKVLGREYKVPLPKKFYTTVTIAEQDGAHAVLLDGRGVRTPKKAKLALPSGGLADAIAAEWHAQVAVINPATMPLTKIANTV
jgi:chaperone required for assembly of F1-ATPase